MCVKTEKEGNAGLETAVLTAEESRETAGQCIRSYMRHLLRQGEVDWMANHSFCIE